MFNGGAIASYVRFVVALVDIPLLVPMLALALFLSTVSIAGPPGDTRRSLSTNTAAPGTNSHADLDGTNGADRNDRVDVAADMAGADGLGIDEMRGDM